MWKAVLVALALIWPLAAAPAFAAKLAPVNEASKDALLAELIARLVRACDEKDFKPFEEALSPSAVASFGGDEGVKGFREVYRIDDPGTTFWADFKTAVTLGGAFMGEGEFGAPYVYASFPEEFDSYINVVAIGPQTSLYAAPKDGAKVVANVTHQILERIDIDPKDAPPAGWLHVKAGKKSGFVKEAETRSPLDYRAVFQKTENRWWLGAFVAGD